MIDLRLAVPAVTGWLALVVALGRPLAEQPGVLSALVWASLSAAAVVGLLAVLARQPVQDVTSGRRRADLLVATGTMLCLSFALTATVSGIALATLPLRSPAPLVEAAERRTAIELSGVASSSADAAAGRLRIRVTAAELSDRRLALDTPMLITNARFDDGLPGLGDQLTVMATVAPVPGGGGLAFFARATAPPQITERRAGLVAWAETLRQVFRETTARLPGDGAALLPGVSIGDTSRVDESLDSAMKASGLSHLTAVSGANCAVIIGLVLALGGSLRLPRTARVVCALLFLLGFVVLVTPEPSVLRASVMAALALCLHLSGRPVGGIPLVATAVTVLLLGNPWFARDYAFSLSVLATAGLVVLTKPLTRILARVLPEPVALLLAVPFVAQLACQPLLLTLEPSIPSYGIVANLLAGPAAPLATVLGLGSCLLGPLWPGAAQLLAAVAWAPTSWIAAVARFSSTLPGARLPWWEGGWALALAILLVAVTAGAILTTPYRRSRRLAVAALAGCLLPVVSVITGHELGTRLSLPSDWQFAQCDVGQGDAVMIRSAHETALVDTGDDPVLLGRCLDRFGIAELDLLVLTHFDRDHVGAAPALLGRSRVVLHGPVEERGDARLVESFREAGARVVEAAPGDELALGEHRLTVLWPPAGTTPGNAASVVLSVRPSAGCASECLSALFLGDLGEREQQRLLGRAQLEPVDVVKVSHHGSRDQSARLYDAIRPRVALIGVGAGNSYGHPSAPTVDLLGRLGSRIVRSDLDGTAALVASGDELEIWREGQRVTSAAPRLEPGRSASTAAEGGPWLQRRPPRRPLSRSPRSPGTRSGPRGSCSCPVPSSSWPNVPSGNSATSCSPKTHGSRSTISRPITMPQEN